MSEWILRALKLLEPTDRFIRVASWRPVWDERYRCIAWPMILADRRGGQRVYSQPLWDSARLKQLFGWEAA